MTTAHRPTWKAAVGRAQEGGWSAGGAVSTLSSVRDVAAHTRLKLREGPQAVTDRRAALAESLRKLEEAERSRKRALLGGAGGGGNLGRRDLNEDEEEESRRKLLTHTADVDEEQLKAKYDDADEDYGDDDNGGKGGGWSDLEDGDGSGDGEDTDLDASEYEDDSDDDSEDDSDEEAALQAELAKIRAEREAAKAREEAERAEEERAAAEEAALTGNPLLSSSGGGAGVGGESGKVKRRWNDDVVFRNQARDEPAGGRAGKRRFINDTVRNDFHRRFLNKFVR